MLSFKQLKRENQESRVMSAKTMKDFLSSYAGTVCGILLVASLLQGWNGESLLIPALTGVAVWATSFLGLLESYLARHLKLEWLGL